MHDKNGVTNSLLIEKFRVYLFPAAKKVNDFRIFLNMLKLEKLNDYWENAPQSQTDFFLLNKWICF